MPKIGRAGSIYKVGFQAFADRNLDEFNRSPGEKSVQYRRRRAGLKRIAERTRAAFPQFAWGRRDCVSLPNFVILKSGSLFGH
jgi:hypothetical protein